MKNDMNLRDIMRSTDVFRWQIVKTDKPQSVAEHSYMVTMIAIKICQVMEVPESVTQQVIWYALCHDLPEVLTGDMATPLKEMIGPEARTRLKEFEESITIMGHPCTRDEFVRQVVKAADLVEAYQFLNENNATAHGMGVKRRLKMRIQEIPNSKICKAALIVQQEMLFGNMTTLDAIVDKWS